MADHILLIGADDVRSAGNTIRAAAEDMRSAANNIDGSLERHQRFLDDWLMRLERTIQDAVTMAVHPMMKIEKGPGDGSDSRNP